MVTTFCKVMVTNCSHIRGLHEREREREGEMEGERGGGRERGRDGEREMEGEREGRRDVCQFVAGYMLSLIFRELL